MAVPGLTENTLSTPGNSKFLAQTDWLGLEKVFYSKQGVATDLNHLVHRIDELSLNPEGLYNYLDFGYSVFGQVPVDGINFLQHSRTLSEDGEGNFVEHHLPDPFDRLPQYRLKESDIPELLRARIREWESSLPSSAEIVLPLSGGYDSRFLLWAIKDVDRVRAFTYGTSDRQVESQEVIAARALATQRGVRWQHLELKGFHNHLGAWYEMFGPAVHAHGMYHIEFYRQVRELVSPSSAVLSGIFGDVWSGKVVVPPIYDASQLLNLSYRHGLCADVTQYSQPMPLLEQRHTFWNHEKEKLEDPRYRVLSLIRLKMILISYLISLPKKMGFGAFGPFLEPEIALGILNLPRHRKFGRLWQVEFFKKEGLVLPPFARGSRQNSLNARELIRTPLPRLNPSVLQEVVFSSYIEAVNESVTRKGGISRLEWLATRGGAVGRVSRTIQNLRQPLQGYGDFLTLYPLHKLLSADREA